jgi:hypothetical protein
MPYRKLPNTRAGVIRTFRTAETAFNAITDPTERAISSAIFDLINHNDPTAAF